MQSLHETGSPSNLQCNISSTVTGEPNATNGTCSLVATMLHLGLLAGACLSQKPSIFTSNCTGDAAIDVPDISETGTKDHIRHVSNVPLTPFFTYSGDIVLCCCFVAKCLPVLEVVGIKEIHVTRVLVFCLVRDVYKQYCNSINHNQKHNG